jgi:hypothetical protein
MTCAIPPEIEKQLADRAAKRQTTIDQLVVEALHWYLGLDEQLLDEFAAWQEVRDEASQLVEDRLT